MSSGPCCRSVPLMGTIVTIEVPDAGDDPAEIELRRQAVARGFELVCLCRNSLYAFRFPKRTDGTVKTGGPSRACQ